MPEIEPGDRPITIYVTLPGQLRDFHDKLIVGIMECLRTAYPYCTFDWEETP